MTPEAARLAATHGADESYRLGTSLVGEVVNNPAGVEGLRGHPLQARLFFEFLGLEEARARDSFAEA